MWKACLLIVMILFSAEKINAQEINFPPELLWWLYEVKKANPNIAINDFAQSDREIIRFNRFYQRVLTYPVFMRWNYSGNLVGYYDYGHTQPRRLPSGRYSIGGDFDDLSTLLIADRNGNVFFGQDFGITSGLSAICWLTDTVLIGVGLDVNNDRSIDLFIVNYRINHANRTVERTFYTYDNAFNNDVRLSLKLDWYKHRTDYFEIHIWD